MIVKRNYYSEKEQVEDPKKKRKLAGAAGASLIGMGGALTGGSKLLKKVQKDVEGLSAKQIKEKFPKLTEKQIEKYMRTATKPENLKKAGRLGYASMAAGAATLGASLYNKKKKAKEKEFAEKDYEGLSKSDAKALRRDILDRETKQASKRAMLANQLRRKKNLKIAGKTALGVAGTAALAVGAKKLYDKKRKSAEDDNTEK